MPILKPFPKKYKDAIQKMPNHIQTNVKSIQDVVMVTKSCAAIMTNIQKPVQIYRVEDAIKEFMQEMLKEKKYCREIIKSKFNKPMRMSQDEEEVFRDEPYMWKAICGKRCQSSRPLPYYGKIQGLCTSRLQSKRTLTGLTWGSTRSEGLKTRTM